MDKKLTLGAVFLLVRVTDCGVRVCPAKENHGAEGAVKTDVLIIGAGPAGTSLAYRLARMGLRPIVLDRGSFPRDKTCGGGLTPRALRALSRLDFPMATLLAHGRPYRGFRIYAPNGQDVAIRYRSNGRGQEMLGTGGIVIRRDWFDAALSERCASAGALVLQSTCAIELLRTGDRISGALVKQGARIEPITSIVTVIATGAQVGLLRAAGLQHPAERPPARATRMYLDRVESGDDLLNVIYTPALAPGYLWIFPVSDSAVNVGLGLGPGTAAGAATLLRTLEDVRRSNPRVGAAFSHAHAMDKPASWALRSTFPHANTYDAGLLVVGEAAGLVDPLTGEGITFALESAELAASVLGQVLNMGRPNREELSVYDRALRQQYADYFETAFRIRSRAAQPELLDVLFRLGSPLARLSGRLQAEASSPPRQGMWEKDGSTSPDHGAPEPRSGFLPDLPTIRSGAHIRAWAQVPPAAWLLWRMARLRKGRSQQQGWFPTGLESE